MACVAAAAACAASAAGCGGGGSASTVPARPLPSYLGLYPRDHPSAVYFLQWERRGNSVDGTLTVVFPSGRDTPTSSHHVEGQIDEQTVKLDVGEDSPQRWEGARTGRRIDFRIELEDGSEQTIVFVPARLAAYKRAVAKVRAGP
ncbi:MAG: hypothetical protein ACM3QU_00820 [Verrucomicrobiota bacterium]